MEVAYFGSIVIGTGAEDDAYRPEIGDEPGISKWEACYEQPREFRAIVRVYADDPNVIPLLSQSYELIYTEAELGD